MGNKEPKGQGRKAAWRGDRMRNPKCPSPVCSATTSPLRGEEEPAPARPKGSPFPFDSPGRRC